MPLIRYALFAAAASVLAGAAAAQPTDNASSASYPPAGADRMSAPDNAGPPAAQTAAGTETSAVVNGQTVQVIASPPVPDTPENRAKYGQPLSRAGKRTKPIGN